MRTRETACLVLFAVGLACGRRPASSPPGEATSAGESSSPGEPASTVTEDPAPSPGLAETGPGEAVPGAASPDAQEGAPLAGDEPVSRDTSDRVPVVRRGEVTVGPKWPPELIRRVLRGADFTRCGATRPAAYVFEVAADGTVTGAQVLDFAGQPSADPAHVCAAEVLRTLRFPAGMGPVTIRYPLR